MVQKFTRPFICFLLAALLWIPVGGNAYAAEEFTNVALNKSATSRTAYSNNFATYGGSKAVDGLFTTQIGQFYVSLSNSGADQWLQIDLEDTQYIDRLEVYPDTRSTNTNELLNGFILISDQPFPCNSSLEADIEQTNQGGWKTLIEDVSTGNPLVFNVGHFGRYVRLRVPDIQQCLSIIELEVYGAESSPETIVNISATENYSKATAVTRTLFPGSYTISLIGSDTEGAEYDAWVYKADTPLAGCRLDGTCKYDGWINRYYYYGTTYTEVPETAFYACKEYASRPENKPADQTLLLEEETEVLFYLNDSNPSNNTGGISLLVSPN